MTSCNQCGACCREAVFIQGEIDRISMEWYRARGFRIVKLKHGKTAVGVPHTCQHLTEDNKCGIQHRKPVACRNFPAGVPQVLLPDGCAFKKVEE